MDKVYQKMVSKLSFERVFAFVLLLSTISSLIYRAYRFDWFNIIAAFVSSAAIVLILNHLGLFFNEPEGEIGLRKKGESKLSGTILAIASGSLFLAEAAVLWHFSSTESIVTPWQVVPDWIFALYFVAVAVTILSLKRSRLGFWFFALGSFTVIPIVYQLGYGYDFFIHSASLREIISTGAILPKTNYYFGQYIFILLAQKLLFVPQGLLHLWLVPLLAAILMPWLAIRQFSAADESWGWFLLLIFPFGFLTFTTPQNFGLLLLLLQIIILSKPSRNNFLMASFLVLFNLTIHPISALPGLTLLLLAWYKFRQHSSRLVFSLSAIIPLLIPVLLLATGAASWTGFRPFGSLLAVTPFTLPDYENIFLNAAYGYYDNLAVIAVLVLAGALFAYSRKLESLAANVGLSLGLIGTVVVMQFLSLRDVIDYEQADYARRILLIAFLVSLPVIAKILAGLAQRILAQRTLDKAIWLIFISSLLTGSFYLSYPRHDNYFNSRGLSVSQADIEAVRYIEQRAQGASYVVLANQQVSAASLREFGFAHYYRGNFYYPIPTTNPLYAYYLDMVYKKPAKETAEAAKNTAGVDKAYFVLNRYWQDFPKLLEEAKLSAKSYQGFENGNVYVFEY
jgi:hypothetical protein